HERDSRTWRAAGRRVTIPGSCSECWNRKYLRRQSLIRTLVRLRTLEIASALVLVLILFSALLFAVQVWVALAGMAFLVAVLVLLLSRYFRLARTLDLPVRRAGRTRRDTKPGA
ncbi:MAG: hypothetical protein ABIK62_05755, partial [candidate division WOR-3 bacterium]